MMARHWEVFAILSVLPSLLSLGSCGSVYRVSTCFMSIQQLTEKDTVLWQPPSARDFLCELRLFSDASMRGKTLTVTFSVISAKLSLPFDSCQPIISLKQCVYSSRCVDVLYSPDVFFDGALGGYKRWTWNSTQLSITVAEFLTLGFCGENVVEIKVSYPSLEVATTAPPLTYVDGSSWNGGNIITRVVLPTMGVSLLVILLSLIALCVVKRFASWRIRAVMRAHQQHQHQQSSSSLSLSTPSTTQTSQGVVNPSFMEEPPMYADFHKYPLSERFQKEMQSKSQSESHVSRHASPLEVVLPPHPTVLAREYKVPDPIPTGPTPPPPPRNVTPPPDYSNTRRVINDVDNISMYEVVNENECQSTNHNIFPSAPTET